MRQILDQNLNNEHTHVGIPTISVMSDILGLGFRGWVRRLDPNNHLNYIRRFRPWFSRVWMPLTMRQISNQRSNNGYMHVHIPTMSITLDLLDFFRI